MPETITALQTALENEAKLFLKLINELEGDELFTFIHRVSEARVPQHGARRTPTDDVIFVARNFSNIGTAIDSFYTI